MKTFKQIDVNGQVFLLVAVIAFNLFNQTRTITSDALLFSYVAVGGWQIISVIVHFFIKAEYKIKLRKLYLALLAITLLAGAICWITDYQDGLIIFLFVLLFWSPILAILYVITCRQETKKLKPIRG